MANEDSGGALTKSSRGLAVALLVAAPVLLGIGYSALAAFGLIGAEAEVGSVGRISSLWSRPAVWRSLGWSVRAAAISTTVAFAAAVLLAATFRSRSRLDRVSRALAVLPLPVPHVVAAFVGVLILGQSGLLARLAFAFGWIAAPGEMAALVYDAAGVGFIATLAAKETPFLALVAFSILAAEAERFEESARSLGAGPLQLFRRITFPLLWRGMLPATIAVFVFVFGSFEVAAMLGPTDPTPYPVLVMERHLGASLAQRADAHLLSLLAFGVAVVAVAVHELLSARRWTTSG